MSICEKSNEMLGHFTIFSEYCSKEENTVI